MKIMKNLLVVILAIFMLTCLTVAASAETVEEHVHTLDHYEAVEPGCHTNGMQEYWYCEGCDCYFTDAEGKYNIARLSLVIPAENTLVHDEGYDAGCHINGLLENWYCAACDCYFTDAEGK